MGRFWNNLVPVILRWATQGHHDPLVSGFDDKIVRQDCIINLFHRFSAIDLKLCIAITDILKICTYYFEEKCGRDRRRAQHGWWTSAARGHHLCLTDNFLVNFWTLFQMGCAVWLQLLWSFVSAHVYISFMVKVCFTSTWIHIFPISSGSFHKWYAVITIGSPTEKGLQKEESGNSVTSHVQQNKL